jgi:hypothetical protein
MNNNNNNDCTIEIHKKLYPHGLLFQIRFQKLNQSHDMQHT